VVPESPPEIIRLANVSLLAPCCSDAKAVESRLGRRRRKKQLAVSIE
jgi:hypothetical protein